MPAYAEDVAGGGAKSGLSGGTGIAFSEVSIKGSSAKKAGLYPRLF